MTRCWPPLRNRRRKIITRRKAPRLDQPVSPQAFLKMAWLANPFAYVAINTLFAVMPGVAEKLALSPTRVGLFCSVWLFGRLAAFALLWQWRGWHYRFRWLFVAFLLLIVSLAAILLATQLWLVVLAQVFFGLATGLIYYSSLFYSMDVGRGQQRARRTARGVHRHGNFPRPGHRRGGAHPRAAVGQCRRPGRCPACWCWVSAA